MSIRHTCNQTSRTSKRHVITQANGVVAINAGERITATENNANLVSFATVADDGTPIVYLGFDYIPCGTNQYDANPIP